MADAEDLKSSAAVWVSPVLSTTFNLECASYSHSSCCTVLLRAVFAVP
jgi:hypothetical protein